jgi:quercetin dioxygenase-like cupin family protein
MRELGFPTLEVRMAAPTALETLHRSATDVPAVPFIPYSEDVLIKLLRVDPVSGQLCVILSAPGGTQLGTHRHYGSVVVYTMKGAWRYLEHDWVARAGDFVYETAGSSHTFVVEPGETTEAFIIVEGALEFIDEDGNTIAIEDWRSMYSRYLDYCEQEGLEPVDMARFDEVKVA